MCCGAGTRDSPVAASEYIIDRWGTNEGLPQGSVLRILQTRDRYLWLATFGGLVRFDGLHFTTFDSGVTPGLRSNRILGLCEDREGTLWIATQESGLVAFREGRFTTYGVKDGLPSEYVRDVITDRNGDVWAGTWKGLVKRTGSRFHVADAPEGLRGADVLHLAAGRNGGVWVGTNRDTYLVADGRAQHVAGATNAILEDSEGFVWLGWEDGLRRIRADGRSIPAEGFPVKGTVRGLYESSDGSLWVGAGDGLWRRKNGQWTALSVQDGLGDNFVRSILEDSEGNLWAGANAGGLHRLRRRRIQIAGGDGAGLPGVNYVPVLEDHAGAMWFGLTCGGLVRFHNHRYQVFTEREGLGGNCVWSLFEDRGRTLWIGTRNGLSRLRDGRFHTYTPANSGLSDRWVTAIHEDGEGALWVATGSGLNRFKDGVFRVYRKADGLVEDDVRFLTDGADGSLWIGSTGGMSRFRDGVFTNYTTETGLPSRFVRAIHPDRSGAVWIGTYGGGLARLREGRFTVFNTANGLPENVVSRILEDEDGHFWLSGNRGIHRVHRRQLDEFAEGKQRRYTVLSYGMSDGMRNVETNGGGAPAGWKSRDGRLWFPTQHGVAVIAPRSIAANPHPPALAIEQVLINGKAGAAGDRIRIPPGRSDLEIRYTGLSFTAPERARFRYKLEGVDADWVDVENRRTAYYTRLPAGSFRFVVTAANGDGVWNEKGTGFDVEVIPPFWATWWFRLMATAAAAAIVALVFGWRVRALERANQEQAAFSRRLIQSQEGERERIAAELHDSIGQTLAIIRNRALVSLRVPDNHARAIEQLDEIASAAGHALEEVRNISYDLRPYHLDRLGLGKAIEVMLAKASDSGEIRFRPEIAGVEGILSRDVEINVYRIVQEAVSNILKHSGATEARVCIRETPACVEILVEDNGKGFLPAHYDPGLGLSGIAERTRLLGGVLRVDSSPGRGTTIRIALQRGVKACRTASGSY